ncbi:MAG: alpha/beta fold hydrolase [Proteobacteria bacterium]|nr:alpha/beta fold hydrolase [Pseudomonadota bacterium]
MSEALPIVLVPGLLASARLYAPQIPVLWPAGQVTVADHTRDDTMAGIAQRILDGAPPRFALVGLSMGGYIAFELLRRAPQRVARLALLDTSARPDTPQQSTARRAQMALANTGRLAEVVEAQYGRAVHPSRQNDAELSGINRLMAGDVGVPAFLRQQQAIMGRADSRPTLPEIRCPTLVLVGDSDALTPPELAAEMAQGIRGAHLVTVARCGHLSTLERPAAVNTALRRWLQDAA